jgi:hypothetical protein
LNAEGLHAISGRLLEETKESLVQRGAFKFNVKNLGVLYILVRHLEKKWP